MKVLFIIGSLSAGGAERSLVSLLNALPSDKYSIDLIVSKKGGLFFPLIPQYINIIEAPFPYNCLVHPPKDVKFYIKHNFIYWFKKVYRIVKSKRLLKQYALQQILWQLWKKDIPNFPIEYDVAISYLEGFPNYYVIDKIKAKKKILWIHSEYKKLRYNPDLDFQYFEKANKIITISAACRQNLVDTFPLLDNNIEVIENLSDAKLIKRMADEQITEISIPNNQLIILSIGRLVPVKSFDLAIKAAQILKQKNIHFNWYIIGDGILRTDLEKLIEKLDLTQHVFLLGLQTNPYKFMKRADIIVQSSSYEGKSIVIDEAKILCKPIVSTNYTTVYDAIKDRETGIITKMTPESLANSIYSLSQDSELRQAIIAHLSMSTYDNKDNINQYISLLES